MIRRAALVTTLALVGASVPAHAQERNIRANPTPPPATVGTAGQLIVVDPLPGNAAGFEDGIRRHLDWMRGAGSSWPWLGFEIVMGERTGQYVLGAFNRVYADWDSPDVDPAGSRESLDQNVSIYVQRSTSSLVRLRADLSLAPPGLAPSPLYEVLTFTVKPGSDRAFEHFWVKFREAAVAAMSGTQYLVYQGEQGTRAGTWVVWVPRASFADMESESGWMESMLAAAPGPYEAGALMETANEMLTGYESEVFRFRPDLSVNVPME